MFPCVHCFPTLSTMTSWTSGRVFNYPAAPLHGDYFLILVMLQCSITALGWWLFTFPYPYPLGKPWMYIAEHRDIFTERATWCPTCFTTNSVISGVIRTPLIMESPNSTVPPPHPLCEGGQFTSLHSREAFCLITAALQSLLFAPNPIRMSCS